MHKLIFFELNEVPVRIFDYYRRVRPGSWLAKNFDAFKKFRTHSENGGHLSPWNTWPTLHRGVSNEKHFISDFNQDLKEIDREFPPIWKLLADAGVKTGVFGSLHSYPMPEQPEKYTFYIPDVFAAGAECFPQQYELFQEINLRLSRESARNINRRIPYVDVLKLMAKSRTMGFKASTFLDVGRQLAEEKINSWKSVRRRTYQSVISFDVYCKLLSREKPAFSTFFTNHVASSQHRYWAALFPKDYEKLQYNQDWINTFSNEIIFTMDKTDQMLSRLAGFVNRNPDYQLMFTSSMGQDAVECEPIETQLYVTDHSKFFKLFGMDQADFSFLPSMLPQFNYKVKDPAKFQSAINQLTVNNANVQFRVLGESRFSIDLGHQNLKETEIRWNGQVIPLDATGMENVIIEDKSSATAYHIPGGHLFIYHPSFQKSDISATEIPTTEIMPGILRNFGVGVPSYSNPAGVQFLK